MYHCHICGKRWYLCGTNQFVMVATAVIWIVAIGYARHLYALNK
jgi:hypothetical protein